MSDSCFLYFCGGPSLASNLHHYLHIKLMFNLVNSLIPNHPFLFNLFCILIFHFTIHTTFTTPCHMKDFLGLSILLRFVLFNMNKKYGTLPSDVSKNKQVGSNSSLSLFRVPNYFFVHYHSHSNIHVSRSIVSILH
jgi:hypothetical protein